MKDELTLEAAIDVFDQLADMRDIAFNCIYDGCYARTHIMCRRLIAAGLTPFKAWAFEGKRILRVNTPGGKKARWSYHVAPTLPVRMQSGGIIDMVFDPGLFDGPVSLQEWGNIMRAQEKNLHVVSFGHPPPSYAGDYDTHHTTGYDTDSRAEKKMREYINANDTEPRVLFQSSSRRQIRQQNASAGVASGATWVSSGKTDWEPQEEDIPEKKLRNAFQTALWRIGGLFHPAQKKQKQENKGNRHAL